MKIEIQKDRFKSTHNCSKNVSMFGRLIVPIYHKENDRSEMFSRAHDSTSLPCNLHVWGDPVTLSIFYDSLAHCLMAPY